MLFFEVSTIDASFFGGGAGGREGGVGGIRIRGSRRRGGKGRNVVATDAGMSGWTRGDVDFDLGVLAREGGEKVGEEFAGKGTL